MLGSGLSSLFGDLEVDVTTDAPIGPSTWFGIGGRASALRIDPTDLDGLHGNGQRCAGWREVTPCR